MKKLLVFGIMFVLTLGVGMESAVAGANDGLSGQHYNLNIIGLKKCSKNGPWTGDCFNGNAGDIPTSGHTIFVPLVTDWVANPCDTTDGSYYGDEIEVAELQKGVRILVTDYYGDEMQVIDRDATDGTAKFNLPDGSYTVYARALGKPGGCMDIDTILCYDLVDDVLVQVDCDPNLTNDQYVLVGHIDVDRSKGKPIWDNVTNELLTAAGVGTGEAGYFDFFWQIYNNNLHLLQLRFYPVN